ncbi:hypothetical protein SPSYN_02484 [Sporotomaculum syntrophicum]|uniref:Uncharacterized protein n=1 Tax=Sporotomaculum syntrophicum TaxID=182264 RepID=A0A9D3AYE2_9FIRM|nr:hypothetical protein SPSYN_02484 [Sporotomaculum syntrophicum]
MLRPRLLDQKDIVILDIGAGIGHLIRGTDWGVDVLLVLEPSRNSVITAKNIQRMAGNLGIVLMYQAADGTHCLRVSFHSSVMLKIIQLVVKLVKYVVGRYFCESYLSFLPPA